jgi:hypothetical protein
MQQHARDFGKRVGTGRWDYTQAAIDVESEMKPLHVR